MLDQVLVPLPGNERVKWIRSRLETLRAMIFSAYASQKPGGANNLRVYQITGLIEAASPRFRSGLAACEDLNTGPESWFTLSVNRHRSKI